MSSESSSTKRKTDDGEVPQRGPKRSRNEPSSNLGPLVDLLDLTDVKVNDSSQLLPRFDQVAKALLRDYALVIADAEYLILELEFYLWAKGHEDPFTHGSEEQRLSGHWYFHRAPRRSADPNRSATSLTGYRGGTRKGLDLTIGVPRTSKSPYFPSDTEERDSNSPSADMRGGILLRTIQRRSDSTVISGPSLLVDEVLRASSAKSIAELVDEIWGGDRYAFSGPSSSSKTTLYLKPLSTDASTRDAVKVFSSPRIGLDLSHPGTTPTPSCPRVVYVSKPYRYFTHPTLLTANGRRQTLLGVYDQCIDKDLPDTEICAKLSGLTGIKIATVSKYLQDYRAGSARNLKSFVGPAGKGACSSPSSYLQMMGAVHAAQSSSNFV